MFEKYWFKPAHQPLTETTVEFELNPLDMRQFHELSRSMVKEEVPSFDQHAAVFSQNVSAWKGIDRECSPAARREICAGQANFNWLIWMGQVTAELYSRALLTSTERKNS